MTQATMFSGDAGRAPRPDAAPVRHDLHISTLTLPLPGGRHLFVAMTRDEQGGAEDLIIAAGYDGQDALRTLNSGVNLPASVLPALRDALEELTR
jgi:hypothetical protein